jgi:hypothetical protein
MFLRPHLGSAHLTAPISRCLEQLGLQLRNMEHLQTLLLLKLGIFHLLRGSETMSPRAAAPISDLLAVPMSSNWRANDHLETSIIPGGYSPAPEIHENAVRCFPVAWLLVALQTRPTAHDTWRLSNRACRLHPLVCRYARNRSVTETCIDTCNLVSPLRGNVLRISVCDTPAVGVCRCFLSFGRLHAVFVFSHVTVTFLIPCATSRSSLHFPILSPHPTRAYFPSLHKPPPLQDSYTKDMSQ